MKPQYFIKQNTPVNGKSVSKGFFEKREENRQMTWVLRINDISDAGAFFFKFFDDTAAFIGQGGMASPRPTDTFFNQGLVRQSVHGFYP